MNKQPVLLSICCAIIVAIALGNLSLAQDDDGEITATHKDEICGILSSSDITNHVHVMQDDVAHQPDADVLYDDPEHVKHMNTPETITIPLTIDVLKDMELNLPEGVEGDAYISEIQIKPDGTVLFEGQDIAPKLTTLCSDQIETEDQAFGDADDETIKGVMPEMNMNP